MLRRLKQNVMVKLEMAKQTEFPEDVVRIIDFCDHSKVDVTAIAKAAELMISNFKSIGMTPSDALVNSCAAMSTKSKNKHFKSVMQNVQEVIGEIAKVERSTAERIETSFLESWAKVWLKEDLKNYLDDIDELKKRRLDKDGLAQSACK
ncbi:unnamed protein product [Thelazia callipaeda]|uniref:CID domain-containing protein n=1 Tax=Thelazia callipaeda TaxID=103827 RepID=A0A0N5CLJ8_THECL|nr:unnamed protein product [Thelazia callipaeda]